MRTSSRTHGPGSARGAQAGQALAVMAFWLLAFLVLVAPFLGSQDGPDPEGDDPGRLLSETDIPFDEDVAIWEGDFEEELGAAVAEASEAWFGLDSPLLADSGLLKLERLASGERAYDAHCVGCHGSTGDGAGPAARHLAPRPRNFRRGVFKFTTTATGSMPLRRDLFQTITGGLSGSSMPDFRLLSEELRHDLVEYVRYLAIRGGFEQLALDLAWDEEEVPDMEEVAELIHERWAPARTKAVYPPIPEIDRTAESVARGREVYMDLGSGNCVTCHGETGVGDGPSAGEFNDDWGYPIQPRDMTAGVFRVGSEPADLYRSIATGINGTPMPSYDSLPPEDIWALVHFVLSLREER